MTADEQIREDDPRTPDVQALLARHLEFALGQTPPEHSFALELDAGWPGTEKAGRSDAGVAIQPR